MNPRRTSGLAALNLAKLNNPQSAELRHYNFNALLFVGKGRTCIDLCFSLFQVSDIPDYQLLPACLIVLVSFYVYLTVYIA